jgi:hypothetical protein
MNSQSAIGAMCVKCGMQMSSWTTVNGQPICDLCLSKFKHTITIPAGAPLFSGGYGEVIDRLERIEQKLDSMTKDTK